MSRADAILSAYERLVDALADDLLDAADEEVLASHTPAAARVAANAFRRRLHRDDPGPPTDATEGPSLGRPQDPPHRLERKP